jgi:predicted Zn finger-like uncharacterized protein
MYTQCPQCRTVYRLQVESLASARGRFRCGHCGTVFDGLERLVDKLPETPFQDLRVADGDGAPVVLAIPAMRPAPVQSSLLQEAKPARREPRLPGEWLHEAERAPESAREKRLPGVAERAARRTGSGKPSAAWAFGSLLLGFALALQVAYAERARLLEHDRVRPWLDQACTQLGCTLPLRRQIDRIELSSREVRPHPDVPNALMISANMINLADYRQAFPIVEVELSDLGDRPIAMRRFRPTEYLADPEAIARGFPAGATAPLVFEVADPGRNAVAFEFRFLPAPVDGPLR